MITDHFWPQHSMFKTPERTRGERGEGGSCTPKRSTSHIVSKGSSCWDIEYLNAQSLNHTHTRHLATVRFCGLHAKPRHALNNYIIDVTPMMQVATRKHQPPATIVDCNHCNGQTTTHNTTHKHFGSFLSFHRTPLSQPVFKFPSHPPLPSESARRLQQIRQGTCRCNRVKVAVYPG